MFSCLAAYASSTYMCKRPNTTQHKRRDLYAMHNFAFSAEWRKRADMKHVPIAHGLKFDQ